MSDTRSDQLLDRLQVELRSLGEDVDDVVLAELAHAVRRQAHEGQLPGYGAVVLDAEQAARTGMTAGRVEFEADPAVGHEGRVDFRTTASIINRR